MKKRRFWISLTGILLAVGCATPTLTPTLVAQPTATQTPALPPTWTPLPTRTPEPVDTGWQTTAAGIEVRSLSVAVGESLERVTLARLDPATVRLRVLYTPGTAYLVSVWAQQADALVVVNAGYFTEEYFATGLTVSNGETFGVPYGDYAGMLAVTEAGAVSLRWLRTWPYDPAEPLRAAVQSFPVLVKPGGVMGFPADADDGRPARRTVVAQDRGGRILLLIAPCGYLSLHALAEWLAESDLDVDIAMNLDGGPSSGFWMRDGSRIDSMVSVPSVIVVTGR